MAGTSHQTRDRANEAVGVLTGNTDLKSEGRADRQGGEAKEKAGRTEEHVEGAIDEVRSIVHPEEPTGSRGIDDRHRGVTSTHGG